MPKNLGKTIDRMLEEGWTIHQIRSRLLKLGYHEKLIESAIHVKQKLFSIPDKKVMTKKYVMIGIIVVFSLIICIGVLFNNFQEYISYITVTLGSVLVQAFVMKGMINLYSRRVKENTYPKALLILLLVNLPMSYLLTLISYSMLVYIPAYIVTGFIGVAILAGGYNLQMRHASLVSTAVLLAAVISTIVLDFIVDLIVKNIVTYLSIVA